MKIDRTSTDEMSLLLYLETRAVDHGGRVNSRHMNEADMQRVKQWNEVGFIRFGRIASQDVTENGAHWVEFSDDAWAEAGALRMERGKRVWSKRRFQTIKEKWASA